MVLGMSVANFTVLHVVISMIAIFAGFIVVGGMFSNNSLGGWTVLFLLATILTTVTGFLFPISTVTPAVATGIVSSLVLVVALVALYGYRLAGRWRTIYVASALLAFYLNFFVLVVQSFQKVAFLQPLAPTGSEPPFLIAQAVALAAFVVLGAIAVAKFHPERRAGI